MALVRLVRAEIDPAFHPAFERVLRKVAYGSKRVALVAARAGGGFLLGAILVGMLSLSVSAAEIVAVVMAWASPVFLAVAALAALVSILATLSRGVLGALRRRPETPRRNPGLVTVVGRVRALRTLAAADGEPVVFSFLSATRNGRGAHLYKAQDFLLEREGEGVIHIEVAHAELMAKPQNVYGARPGFSRAVLDLVPSSNDPMDIAEATLRDGDRVEATGLLEERVDPRGERSLGRETPMLRVLHGTWKVPLRLRRA
jgi:hypothetical protein